MTVFGHASNLGTWQESLVTKPLYRHGHPPSPFLPPLSFSLPHTRDYNSRVAVRELVVAFVRLHCQLQFAHFASETRLVPGLCVEGVCDTSSPKMATQHNNTECEMTLCFMSSNN